MTTLFLIGMPGSGKTTMGEALATYFGWPFLDLDAEIVNRAGLSISAIFQQLGEAHFRDLEADTLRAVASQAGALVLATGGGTPCFHHNMEWLNAHGITLWLDVPVPVLAARLAGSSARPLVVAAGPAPETWLRETLAHRTQFYQQARLRCSAPACTVAAVAMQLQALGLAPGQTV